MPFDFTPRALRSSPYSSADGDNNTVVPCRHAGTNGCPLTWQSCSSCLPDKDSLSQLISTFSFDKLNDQLIIQVRNGYILPGQSDHVFILRLSAKRTYSFNSLQTTYLIWRKFLRWESFARPQAGLLCKVDWGWSLWMPQCLRRSTVMTNLTQKFDPMD